MSSLPAGGWIIRLNRVDLITLSSVPLTLLALFFTLQQELLTALALLFLAMTADALDGLLARRWGLTRVFGRYLDGFMDVLIYLVSPALILLQWGFDGIYAVALVAMVAAGCIRLSVFNQTGNIEDASKGSARPAYLGMPVFWSLLIIAPLVLLEHWLGACAFIKALLALALLWFSVQMLRARPFFKFTSLAQMLWITLGGFSLLCVTTLAAQGAQAPWHPLLMALYLQVPVVIGGVAHMWCVSNDVLPSFARPVWKSAFGSNKTWRGVLLVPLLTALGALCLWPLEQVFQALGWPTVWSGYSLLLAGAMAGVGYILGELPNSWFKRRLGIAPGQVPEEQRYWFIALDQIDSAVGVALILGWWLDLSAAVVLLYILTFPLTALLVKQWLYRNKLKDSAV